MRENVSAPIDQRGARLAEPQRIVGDRQRKDEPGADRLHVERGAPLHAEPRLHLGRGRREGVVGGRGREHDQIEIAAAHAGAAERPLRGADGQIRGQLAVGGDPALADAGALADPLVGGIEPGGQLVIGDDPLGQIGAAAGDLGAQRRHRRAYSAAD